MLKRTAEIRSAPALTYYDYTTIVLYTTRTRIQGVTFVTAVLRFQNCQTEFDSWARAKEA